jgi:hypothetical protein
MGGIRGVGGGGLLVGFWGLVDGRVVSIGLGGGCDHRLGCRWVGEENRLETYMINPIALNASLETEGKMTESVSPKRTTKATLPLTFSYVRYT